MASPAVTHSGSGLRGVLLRPEPVAGSDLRWHDLADQAGAVDGNVGAAIDLARVVGKCAPAPGGGDTAGRWELLATLAAVDLTAARVAEAHLDALAILEEAQVRPGLDLSPLGAGPDSTWGVFAAEAPAVRLQGHATDLRR